MARQPWGKFPPGAESVDTVRSKRIDYPVIYRDKIVFEGRTSKVIIEQGAIRGDLLIDGSLDITGEYSDFVWIDYTPTFVNFTLGNGTIDIARYIQIGKLVILAFRVTLGSTSSMGTAPTLSLPVTAVGNPRSMGNLLLVDTGTSSFYGDLTIASTTTVSMVSGVVSGSYLARTSITASVPFTWTTADWFDGIIHYEAA